MRVEYKAERGGTSAAATFTPDTELDKALLIFLASPMTVFSTRAECGTRALLEVRLVRKGLKVGNSSAAPTV
jgi:hypothetical protein